jgi:hypothetical protein
VSRATLTLFKAGFLVALYLFLFRAVRAVYLELSPKRLPPAGPPQGPPAAPVPAAVPAEAAVRRQGRSTQRIGSSRKPPTSVAVLGDGRTYPLQGDLVIGRASTATIVVDDTYASSAHARIRSADGSWVVEDLGSTNGTLVNGERIATPTPVRRGDRVQVGQTVLELRG